jgi:O-antigen/teichoic acid export membrane protein
MSNTKRIAKNTLMLYFRQILIMLVSLYTVRAVLETLGAEDYGIYNVVAGVVTMFGFLSGSMAQASQRYFSFELGRQDYKQLRRVFSSSLIIYIFIAAIVFVLTETLGLWFIKNKLIIPPERKAAALLVYQCSIVSFLFTILVTPYMAVIIAHENMNIYAYMSIIEIVLKLAIVYIIRLLSMDKMILYGILFCIVAFINSAIYKIICTKKYDECRFQLCWNPVLFNEIIGYTGWNLFGNIAWLARNQGINILLNIFFGPLVNAARSISSQINTVVSSFGSNFSTSVYPQIIKSYSIKDNKSYWDLTMRSSKFCYFLFLILSMPLLLETDFILALWLKNVPEYTSVFTRLILIDALLVSFTYSFGAANQATGNIKIYQLIIGGFLILNIPVAILFFLLGLGPEVAMIISVVFSFCALIMRIIILKVQINFPVVQYLKGVILVACIITGVSLVIPLGMHLIMQNSFTRFLIVCCTSVICCLMAICFIGLNRNERKYICGIIQQKLQITIN